MLISKLLAWLLSTNYEDKIYYFSKWYALNLDKFESSLGLPVFHNL